MVEVSAPRGCLEEPVVCGVNRGEAIVQPDLHDANQIFLTRTRGAPMIGLMAPLAGAIPFQARWY